MSFECHHLDKWAFANLDLVEESLEKGNKPVLLVSGASSSGKSYSTEYLMRLLNSTGHHSLILSLDKYNVGLSRIIPNKVALNDFDNHIDNLGKIEEIIHDIIVDVPFDKKYDHDVLEIIRGKVKSYFSDVDLDKFINGLYREWKRLNFDEPTVYDLKEAAADVKELIKGNTITAKNYSKVVSERIPSDEMYCGKDYDVILVEGIYALDPTLLDELEDVETIKDFVDGNPKSLFLRRIIRDAKTTSADNVFTISAYFRYIVKSYFQSIYPCREYADVILNNDMTFTEMRGGDLYTTKEEIHTFQKKAFDEILSLSKVIEVVYQKDTFFSAENESGLSNNILRLRAVSKDGIHYEPTSLVHKGVAKVRRDEKIIRPINVLLKEGEFYKVWKDEGECLNDFLSAGFRIGPIKYKTKTRVTFEGRKMTLREVKDNGYYIEFTEEPTEEVKTKVKTILAKYAKK